MSAADSVAVQSIAGSLSGINSTLWLIYFVLLLLLFFKNMGGSKS